VAGQNKNGKLTKQIPKQQIEKANPPKANAQREQIAFHLIAVRNLINIPVESRCQTESSAGHKSQRKTRKTKRRRMWRIRKKLPKSRGRSKRRTQGWTKGWAEAREEGREEGWDETRDEEGWEDEIREEGWDEIGEESRGKIKESRRKTLKKTSAPRITHNKVSRHSPRKTCTSLTINPSRTMRSPTYARMHSRLWVTVPVLIFIIMWSSLQNYDQYSAEELYWSKFSIRRTGPTDYNQPQLPRRFQLETLHPTASFRCHAASWSSSQCFRRLRPCTIVWQNPGYFYRQW